MDEKGRKKHKESETKAIKSVKFVCLKTARNYEAFGCQSNQLRDFFKAEDGCRKSIDLQAKMSAKYSLVINVIKWIKEK